MDRLYAKHGTQKKLCSIRDSGYESLNLFLSSTFSYRIPPTLTNTTSTMSKLEPVVTASTTRPRIKYTTAIIPNIDVTPAIEPLTTLSISKPLHTTEIPGLQKIIGLCIECEAAIIIMRTVDLMADTIYLGSIALSSIGSKPSKALAIPIISAIILAIKPKTVDGVQEITANSTILIQSTVTGNFTTTTATLEEIGETTNIIRQTAAAGMGSPTTMTGTIPQTTTDDTIPQTTTAGTIPQTTTKTASTATIPTTTKAPTTTTTTTTTTTPTTTTTTTPVTTTTTTIRTPVTIATTATTALPTEPAPTAVTANQVVNRGQNIFPDCNGCSSWVQKSSCTATCGNSERLLERTCPTENGCDTSTVELCETQVCWYIKNTIWVVDESN